MPQTSEQNTAIYRRRALTLVTRCHTIDEFVKTYGGQLSGGMITLTARRSPRTGVRRRFRICLRDHTTVLSGDGVVADCERSADRVALHFRLLAVDDAAAPLMRRLEGPRCARGSVPGDMSAHRERLALPLPAPDKTSITRQAVDVADDDEFDDDDEAVTTVHRPETIDQIVASLAAGDIAPDGDPTPAEVGADLDAAVSLRPRRRWLRTLGMLMVVAVAALSGGWLSMLPLRAPEAKRIASRPAATTTTTAAAPAQGAPGPASTPAVTPIARPLATPQPSKTATCTVTVESSPRGAMVLYNGKRLGTTPLLDKRVPCGAAEVRWQHAGYQNARQRVRARAGKHLRLSRRLKRSYRRIKLASSPPGAVFLVNGRFVLETGNVAYVPSNTSVIIRASKRGYRDWTRRVYVANNRSVRARLRKK